MKLPRAEHVLGAELPSMRRSRQALNPLALAIMLVLAGAVGDAAWAQVDEAAQGSNASGVTVATSLTVGQTVTDNVSLQPQKDAALITVVTPGIRVTSRGGRVTGSLDYSLSGIAYLKTEHRNEIQQSLYARGIAELIEKRFFLDAMASITQQTISAFGTQSPDRTLANANQSEVASLYLGPNLKGYLSDWARYELRGNFTETNAKNSIGDSRIAGGALRVDGMGGRKFGWWGSLSSQKTHFDEGFTDTSTALANLGLSYQADPDLQLGINAGPERNNYFGFDQTGNNYGVNAIWLPSPRTSFRFDWQYHDYGNTHSVSFEHRLARSAIRFFDMRGVMFSTQTRSVGAGNNYDLIFQQFASIEPDPVKRDVLVRAFLQGLGISPDSPITGGSLSNAPTMDRRQQLMFSLEGLRTTVIGALSQASTERLGAIVPTEGDLAFSNRVNQRGISLTLAHRLTPISTANMTLLLQRSDGDIVSDKSQLRSATLTWATRLNARTSASAGARYSEFESPVVPYSETAIFANLVLQF